MKKILSSSIFNPSATLVLSSRFNFYYFCIFGIMYILDSFLEKKPPLGDWRFPLKIFIYYHNYYIVSFSCAIALNKPRLLIKSNIV